MTHTRTLFGGNNINQINQKNNKYKNTKRLKKRHITRRNRNRHKSLLHQTFHHKQKNRDNDDTSMQLEDKNEEKLKDVPCSEVIKQKK